MHECVWNKHVGMGLPSIHENHVFANAYATKMREGAQPSTRRSPPTPGSLERGADAIAGAAPSSPKRAIAARPPPERTKTAALTRRCLRVEGSGLRVEQGSH